MKKTKKGFTIVELIIVIAVIAVLTAILVPTFIHLTKKANEAADHSLVTNLNKALAMREAEEGDKGKNNTMYDCVMDLDQEGYKLPQLATRSDEDLVWSQQTNRFFLSSEYNAEKHGGKYNCWHIYEQMPTEQTWAIYPNEDKWTTADVENLKVGFDAGKAEVKSVLYNGDAGNTVTIRTNGSVLTINAPKDTVHHYADLDELNITAIANESYHEHGRVKVKASIQNGHLVVEENGFINELAIPETASSVSVDLEKSSEVGTVVLDSSTAEVVINSGAEVDQVIAASTSNISGSGAAEAKEKAVQKTLVGTKDEMDAAIADEVNVKYILLKNDIALGTRLTLDRDIIIDGSSNKYSLTFASENISNGRAINIGFDVPNKFVTLKNLNIVGPTSGSFTRGLNIGEVNTKVIVDNCDVSCKYYAVNIISNASNVNVTITNSKISGWASINLWASNKIDITNSELIGKSISANEGFANICFEADTTSATDLHVSDAKVTVKYSVIKTIYGYESGDGYQALVGYNYYKNSAADHNSFEAVNCDLQWEGPNSNLLLAYDYCNLGTTTSNVTIINGKTLDFGSNWYIAK